MNLDLATYEVTNYNDRTRIGTSPSSANLNVFSEQNNVLGKLRLCHNISLLCRNEFWQPKHSYRAIEIRKVPWLVFPHSPPLHTMAAIAAGIALLKKLSSLS